MHALKWPSLKRGDSDKASKPVAPLESSKYSLDDIKLPFSGSVLTDRMSPSVYKTPPLQQTAMFSSLNTAGDLASPAPSQGSNISFLTRNMPNAAQQLNKDSLLLELLSSQAMLEAKTFEVLNWHQLERVKKHHQKLINRINTLTHKLSLEQKIRNASSMLADSDGQSDSGNEKASAIEKELATLRKREGEVRTKLLTHMAGVLSLVLAKKEEETLGVISPSLMSSQQSNGLKNGHRLGLSSASSPTESETAASSSSSHAQTTAIVIPFEGPHMFATSSDLTQTTTFETLTSPGANGFPGHDAVDPVVHAELEKNLEESDRALVGLQQRLDVLQTEHNTLLDHVQQQEDEIARIRSQLKQTEHHAKQAELRAADFEQGAMHGAHASQLEADSLRRTLAESTERHQEEQESWARSAQTNQVQIEAAHEQLHNYAGAILDISSRHNIVDTTQLPAEDDHESMAYLFTALDEHLLRQSSDLDTAYRDFQSSDGMRQEHEQIVRTLATQLKEAQVEVQSSSDQLRAALSQQETLKHDLESQFMSRTASDRRNRDLESEIMAKTKALDDLKALQDEASTAKNSAADLSKRLEEFQVREAKTTQQLSDLYRGLPNTDSRPISSSLSGIKSVFARGFSPSTETPPSLPFRLETFCDRIRDLAAEQRKLIDKISQSDADHETHSNTIQSKLQTVTTELAAAKKDLDEAKRDNLGLQNQLGGSAAQQAALLDRLNELQETAEKFRTEKKTVEQASSTQSSRVKELETTCASLQADLKTAQMSAKAAHDLEVELEEVRGQLQDAEDELAATRTRENKKRAEMMAEIDDLQKETASLRAQLRQEQRKKKSTV